MIIYPAIDLLGGKAVRLRQGDYNEATAFSDDPMAVVQSFEEAGATWLHLVDLDAARGAASDNRALIERICRETELKVQVGGGIRTKADIANLLECGATRLVLGTAAVRDPAFLREVVEQWPDQITVGIDVLNGTVRVQGWTEDAGLELFAFALLMRDVGVRSIIYTDISRDGELEGPNLETCRQLKEELGMHVILSGGVSSREDVAMADDFDIDGVIIGKAIYEGRINLAEVIREFES